MHKRILILPFLILLVIMRVNAQSANSFLSTLTISSFASNGAEAMHMSADSCYLVVGDATSNQDSRSYFIKMDQDGQLLWSKQYGDSVSKVYVRDFALSPHGGYMLTAEIDSMSVASCLAIIRVDVNGTMMWSKKFRDPACFQWDAKVIRATTDGGYVMTGAKVGNNYSMAVLKTDSLGNIEWSHNYCIGPIKDRAYDIRELPDSGFVLCGKSYEYNPQNMAAEGIYVLRIDKHGNPLWGKGFGSSQAYPYCLRIAPDGGIVVTGFSYGAGFGGVDVVLLKLDTAGTLQWMHQYGTSAYEIGLSCDILSNGNMVIAGAYSTPQSPQRGMLLLTDSAGNLLNTFEYPGASLISANYVLASPDGGALITGYSMFQAYQWRTAFVKIPPSGELYCGTTPLSFGDTLVVPQETQGFSMDSSGYAFPGIEKYESPVPASVQFMCGAGVSFYSSLATVCENTQVDFTNVSDTNSTAYWYVNNVLADSSFNFSYSFSTAGAYTIMLVSQPAADTSQMQISVLSPPVVTLTLPDTICNDLQYFSLYLYSNPPGGIFTTTFGTGDTSIYPQVMPIGYSPVSYTYTNVYGCSASASAMIYIDSCTSINGLSPMQAEQPVRFFYNAQADELNLLFTDNNAHEINLFNTIGQLVYSTNLSGRNVQVPLNDLPAGLYIVVSRSGNFTNAFRFIETK